MCKLFTAKLSIEIKVMHETMLPPLCLMYSCPFNKDSQALVEDVSREAAIVISKSGSGLSQFEYFVFVRPKTL